MTATIELEQDRQDEAAETEGAARGQRLGRALDVAGVVAGVVLGVILFDIISGGKLTRWARSRRGPAQDSGPCEGCQDKDEGPE